MIRFRSLSNLLKYLKRDITEISFESILWVITIIPRIFGFYVLRDNINVVFWTLNIGILFYMYGVGSLLYQIRYADDVLTFVMNYVNVTILILTFNISYWYLTKRTILKEVFRLVKRNDDMVSGEEHVSKKHQLILKKIKYFLMIYLIMNYLLDIGYQSKRVNLSNDFAIVNCPGIEPLTVFPKREICTILILIQEWNILLVVSNYHMTFLFLLSHTAAMYDMLSEELVSIDSYEQIDNHTYDKQVKYKLHNLTQRHQLILKTIEKLKILYSKPIGIDFASNALCICLVMFVPTEELNKLVFVFVYCFSLFLLYCFLCQKLTNASENFERTVYVCNWENFRVPEKKMIFMMLRQSQKPTIILAAYIVPVNMYTFATTIQSIYKFVTVMRF